MPTSTTVIRAGNPVEVLFGPYKGYKGYVQKSANSAHSNLVRLVQFANGDIITDPTRQPELYISGSSLQRLDKGGDE